MAMRFGISPRKALSMCGLCCPLGTVNTLGVVLVMAYCAFLSLRTVLMALKTEGSTRSSLRRVWRPR